MKETFFRLKDEDVEVRTHEIVGTGDFFNETNTIEVLHRPNWSDIWRVTSQASSQVAFDVEDFSPNDEPYSVSVRVERIG